jgi:hypothetical protein
LIVCCPGADEPLVPEKLSVVCDSTITGGVGAAVTWYVTVTNTVGATVDVTGTLAV